MTLPEGAKLATSQETERREWARRLIMRGKETLDEIAEDLDMPLSEIQKIAGTKPN